MKSIKSDLDQNLNKKLENLAINSEDVSNQKMTTNQGVLINDNNNSLKAGECGST